MTMTAERLGPLEILPDPASHQALQRRHEDQRELMRRAAVTTLKHVKAGRIKNPAAIRWAESWAAVEPLGRPLSTGEPT